MIVWFLIILITSKNIKNNVLFQKCLQNISLDGRVGSNKFLSL